MELFSLVGNIFVNGEDAVKSITDVEKKAEGMSGKLGKSIKSVGKFGAGVAAAIGTAAVATGIKATKSAIGFEESMANISTLLTGDFSDSLESMGDGIKQLAKDTGTSVDVLADGAYEVVSAFGEQADVMGILETANKTAVAGNATTTESVELLSAVTKGYGDISAEATDKASDLAFQTVKLGQTSIPELAASMGKIIPLAGSLSVSQEELFGTMATLTGVTGNTAEVSTQLRGVFSELMKPSDDLSAALSSMGYESGEAAIESLGFQGVLDGLKDSVGGNDQALNNMFGSVQAGTAVLALTGEQSDVFTEKLNNMNDATGASADAFEKQQATVGAMMQRISENLNVVMIELGEEFLPLLETFLVWVIDHMPEIQAVISKVFEVIGTVVRVTSQVFKEHIMPVLQSMYDWVLDNLPAIQAIWDNVWGAIKGIVQGAVDIIGGIVKVFTGILSGDFEMLSEGLQSIWTGAWTAITAIVEGAWGLLSGAFSGLKNSIVEWFTGLIADFKSFGGDLISGMWEGISNKADWLVEQIKGLGSLVTGAVKKLFGIKSPSTVFAEIGKNLIEGLGVGIDGQRKGILAQVSDLANELTGQALEMDLQANVDGTNASGRLIGNKGNTGAITGSRIDSGGGTTQNITINSPKSLNPSETAREMKTASRKLALGV